MHASWTYSEKDLEAATDPECISAGTLEHIKIGPCNATNWQNTLHCIKVSVQFKVLVVTQKVLPGRGSDYRWVLQCPIVSAYPTKYHRNWNCRTVLLVRQRRTWLFGSTFYTYLSGHLMLYQSEQKGFCFPFQYTVYILFISLFPSLEYKLYVGLI